MQPQVLTEEQKTKIRLLKQEGKSLDEIKSYLAGSALGSPSTIAYEKGEVSTPSSQKKSIGASDFATGVAKTVIDIPQDITQLGQGVLNVGKNLYSNVKSGFLNENISIPSKIANIPSSVVSAGTGLVGEGIGFAMKAAVPPSVEQATADVVGQGIEKAMQTDTVKSAVDWYNSQDEQTKFNVTRLMLPAADLVTTVAPVGMFNGLLSKVTGKADIPKPNVEQKITEAFTKAEAGDIGDATRIANATLDPATRETEVAKLAKAYQDSLVGDRVKVNRLLQEQAADMSRGGVTVTQDDLIKAMANEGIIPDLRGKLADFTTAVNDLSKRQDELFKAYEPVLAASKATASVDDFSQYALRSMSDSPNLRFELDKASSQLDSIIANLRRSYNLDETGTLTAKQIDDISRQANARTKAYRETDTFQADVYSELGRAARKWLNDNIPDESFRKVNDEWLRLEQIKRTAEAMQNQQVDIGIIGRALGSYVTTLTGVTLAASVGNPFTAVAAGILTKMGGDQLADMLRSTRFSPEIRAKLQERLTSDKDLIARLKETATTQENKNMYDQLSRMLPAPKEGAYRSEVSGGTPIRSTAEGQSAPAGQIIETAKPGAIKKPGGDGTQPLVKDITDIETEIRDQMRAAIDMSEVTLSVTEDGKYLRNSSFPNWLPEDKELRSKDLMEKVFKHIENGTVPNEDYASNQFRLYEVMKQHMERVKFDKLNAQNQTGFTADDIPFAIVLTAGVLGAYYTMGDDGTLAALPVAGFMASTPGGRKMMVAELKRSIRQMEKVANSTKDKPTLNRLQKGIDSAKLEIQKLEGKGEGATPNLADDIAKAKAEGKTFEEWVSEQGTKLVRGSGKSEAGNVDLYGKGLYLTDDVNVAKFYGDNISESIIKGDILDASRPLKEKDFKLIISGLEKELGVKLDSYAYDKALTLKNIADEIDSIAPPNSFINWAKKNDVYNDFNPSANVSSAINKVLKSKGVVGIKYSTDEIDDLYEASLGGKNAFVIFDENAIKTRAQLKAEWNKVTTPNSSAVSSSLLEEARKSGVRASKAMNGEWMAIDDNTGDLLGWYKTEAEALSHKKPSVNKEITNTKTAVDKNGGEIIDIKGNPVPINDDGTITLYHRTTPENAQRIKETGKFFSKENTNETFFSNKLDGNSEGYGKGVVVVRVPANKIAVDDAFTKQEISATVSNKDLDKSLIVDVFVE